MSIADEIEKLERLRQSGALSDDEYQAAKAAQFRQGDRDTTLPATARDERTWTVLLHVSQLCGFVLPLAGFVVPIVLWQLKKDQSASIDRHGRIVANWLVTALIAGTIFWLLSFLVIGIPLLMILALLCVVFPLIGATRASKGEAWPYPMSWRLWAVDDLPD